MGCTLDHSPVAFSISRRYTKCVFLMRKVPLSLPLQTFKDVNDGDFFVRYFSSLCSLKLHANMQA